MGRDGAEEVMVMRPTKADFARPFAEYVRKVLKKHPDVPMFKVVPPEGWRPRRRPFPKLESVDIQTPIKQIVYGKGGAYRCILMEQRGVTAQRFKEMSESDGHTPPESKRGKDLEDELLERAFWSSVTINPPFYGADTPQSFFDEKLEYGWNLRSLEGCLLHKMGVDIPGVTTPMTYFGMWKAFFSWHVEDADLFSINYLHFGAPKVWYCVAPSQRAKFERMAQSLYPELHRSCHAFMRHKDILLSPQMLRTYGVEYTMAKQEPNEFIVLNAAAYHAGYNLGFNCAEAINFAMPEWIDVGRQAMRCKCNAMSDGVRISMKLFGCESDSDDASDDDSSGTEATGAGTESEEEEEGEEEEGIEEAEEEEEEDDAPQATRRSARQPKPTAPALAGAKRGAAAAAAVSPPPPKRPKGRMTRTAMAAAAAASKQRSTRTSAEARAKMEVKRKRAPKVSPTSAGAEAAKAGIHPTDQVLESLERAAAAAAALRAAHEERLARHQLQQHGDAHAHAHAHGGAASGSSSGGGSDTEFEEPVSGSEPPSPTATRALLRRGGRLARGGGAGEGDDGEGGGGGAPAGAAPQVIVGESSSGKRFFYLVQTLSDVAARHKGHIVMRWLKESADGLFRPSSETWEEKADALVDVRTQWVRGAGGKPGGWRLLTLRSRILDTQLVDA